MNFRNISSWCIQHPVPPIVLFIGLLLAGIVAFAKMDVNNLPDVEFPMAIVSVSQPGAAPSELETQVTRRVESAARGLEGVEEINSTVREGNSNTQVSFQIGTPLDRAVTDLRDAISQIRGDLPEGIMEPQVQRALTNGGGEFVYIAAETDDLTVEQLSWYVDNKVSRTLLGVVGVAAVTREGGVDRQIRVELDPVALQSQGTTAAAVNAQLRQINTNAAGGRAELAGSEQTVRVLGNSQSAYELSQQQIVVGGGRVVRLAELGNVRDGTSEERSAAFLGGKPVVSFNVQRARGASEVTVYDATWEQLKKLEKDDPRVRFTEIDNTTDYTKSGYKSSVHALLEGAVLAVIVVFLFLRDIRATLISAVAIPLSAIPAFYFMDLMGINLNFLSLLALALVAGVLVDDAIVEIENIVRHMRMGKSAYQASMDAADEIGLAVVATTMSIVAVFLPVAMMPGISGEFFRNFGYTVVIAVLISLLVARMITPLMAAYFLKSHGEEAHAEGPAMKRYLKLLRWSLDTSKADALLERLPPAQGRASYYIGGTLLTVVRIVATIAALGVSMQLLGKISPHWSISFLLAVAIAGFAFIGAGMLLSLLVNMIGGGGFSQWYHRVGERNWARRQDHRMAMVGIGIFALFMTAVAFGTLSSSFEPEQDQDSSRVRIGMPPGTTIDQTKVVAKDVAAILRQHPDVERTFQRVFTGAGFVNVRFKDDRSKKSFEIERELTPELAKVPNAQVNFMSQGGGGAGGRPITLFLGSDDPVLLNQAAQKIVDEMAQLPELVAPRIQGDNVRPEVLIKPRFDLAADLGVTTTALSQTIRIATIGDIDQNSAKFSLSDRQVPIIVSLPKSARADLTILENLPVPTNSGGSVPLKAVADIEFGAGPVTVQRTNQVRRIAIGADLAPGLVSGDAWKKINVLPSVNNLPDGVQKLTLGDQKWQGELIQSFIIAVVSGILLVFAVLVLLYRRFLSPLVNMGSLMLAPLGAGLALHLAGMTISLPVYIGILMLFGIVAKNSILLVDFAVEMMDHGMPKDDAIHEAGHKRAQPIVMTTVAMVAGMIPTALSLGGDGSWRAPMGVTVIGGLLFSTMLTLLLVPAYFSIAVDLEKGIGAKFKKLIVSEDDVPGAAGPHPVPAE